MQEPWKYFEGLQLDDVEALHDDIKDYAVSPGQTHTHIAAHTNIIANVGPM
jgi:hypothetical protein